VVARYDPLRVNEIVKVRLVGISPSGEVAVEEADVEVTTH